ncbi:MAG: peptidase M42 [candidate division Zixibacteria bacterium]|nr:peptidase M42 [candidate division Zixibacteria bacterium]
MPNPEYLVSLLQELIYAHGPSGQEDAVRSICLRELETVCDKVWTDPAGNAIGLIRGGDGPVVRVMAHMDELAMIVKRVNDDGTLRVHPLGGMWPANYGQGPVEILADTGVVPGILSVGSMHTTAESAKIWETKARSGNKAMDWDHLFVFTRKTPEQLKTLGIHAGTRVAIAHSRRTLFEVDDCIGGYFMDNRAAIAISLGAAALLERQNAKPAGDVYLVMTTIEEIGAHGASYASRTLPGDITLAVDSGPVAAEYGVALTAEPIVVYGDAMGLYDLDIADRLLACGRALGMDPQCAFWQSYGSDASIPKAHGQTARAGLLCIATENTHGFEIVPTAGLGACARLLAAFLKG